MTLDQIVHALQVLRAASGTTSAHYVNGKFVAGGKQ